VKPTLTSLFRVCAIVSSLLVDAVESGEVAIGADELERFYDVLRPIRILSDENNEGISVMLFGNASEGEVDSKPEFPVIEKHGNYKDEEDDFEVETDACPFTSQEFPILAYSSTLVPNSCILGATVDDDGVGDVSTSTRNVCFGNIQLKVTM